MTELSDLVKEWAMDISIYGPMVHAFASAYLYKPEIKKLRIKFRESFTDKKKILTSLKYVTIFSTTYGLADYILKHYIVNK